jgi:2-C-methyl-D-erythritol 4-phosphate cytidylyltransferase
MQMKVIALVPAAGSGERMALGRDDKPFLRIQGKPVLLHVLSRLNASGRIDEVVLVVKEKYLSEAGEMVAREDLDKVKKVVAGGDTRSQSVKNGIARSGARDEDLILIHDGVRPFVTDEIISRAVEAAVDVGAAVVGVPCASTIKKVGVDLTVESTPARSGLWEAQTPQVFRADIIKEAYDADDGTGATDDSCLVERIGYKVSMVKGTRDNIKITVPEDVRLAEAIMDRTAVS